MKHVYAAFIALFSTALVHAQVGIGTTSPNSTLDLRGSFSPAYRSFSGSTTLTSIDYTSIFTGTAAATVTLPDATTCGGRLYVIKNYSATSPAPVLTVATTGSQQIDGYSSWTLDVSNEVFAVVSDGSNWEVQNLSTPAPDGGSGTSWVQGGNTMTGTKSIGTINAYDMPFITSNTERMRITSAGNVGIGSTTFSSSPEALLVYQNSSSSFNVIGGKGKLNNYLQLNIQNQSNGANASSDLVATADNGTETSNYVDLGINSSGYSSSGVIGGANNAYLYSQANDFVIGNDAANHNLIFFTTDPNSNTAERMRITPAGAVGIGSSSFSANPEALLVYQDSSTSFNVIGGKGNLNNYLQLNIQNKNSGANASSDVVATADNGNETTNYVDLGINSSGYNTSSITGGVDNAYLYSQANDFVIGNGTNNHNLIFFTTNATAGAEHMRINSAGNVGINNTNPAAQLDVAGTVKIGTAGTVLNSIIRFTNQSITDNNQITYNQTRTETFTLTGVNQYASVIVTPRSMLATGLGIAFAYASAANTVTMVINNASGNDLALGTVAFDITVIQ